VNATYLPLCPGKSFEGNLKRSGGAAVGAGVR
jgi:hypothetical protein